MNLDISSLPVHPLSQQYLDSIGVEQSCQVSCSEIMIITYCASWLPMCTSLIDSLPSLLVSVLLGSVCMKSSSSEFVSVLRFFPFTLACSISFLYAFVYFVSACLLLQAPIVSSKSECSVVICMRFVCERAGGDRQRGLGEAVHIWCVYLSCHGWMSEKSALCFSSRSWLLSFLSFPLVCVFLVVSRCCFMHFVVFSLFQDWGWPVTRGNLPGSFLAFHSILYLLTHLVCQSVSFLFRTKVMLIHRLSLHIFSNYRRFYFIMPRGAVLWRSWCHRARHWFVFRVRSLESNSSLWFHHRLLLLSIRGKRAIQ